MNNKQKISNGVHITKEEKANAEVVLKGTLTAQAIEQFYEKALAEAVKNVALPGFRKGNVPRERVIDEVGEGFLWKDAAERALKEDLSDILEKENITPLTPLSLALTPQEGKGDVDFEITAVVPPTCTLTDYKAVAKKALAALPKDDFEKERHEARRAFRTQVRTLAQTADPSAESAHKKEAPAPEKAEAEADTPLTDEEAKSAGFENSKALEHFIEGEAKKAVADRNQQKKRGAVAEALIAAATCSIPQVLVAEEARALLEMFKKDVVAQNMQWNDYLKRVGKSEEQVQADLNPNAEKRIILDVVFGNIVREEKLERTEEDKKKEEEFAHKIAEQGVDHDRAHAYAREQFLREKVWEALGVK